MDFKRNFLVAGQLQNVPSALPVQAQVLQLQFVSRHKSEIVVLLGEEEISHVLLVETHVPVHAQVVLRLTFFHFLVVISLHFDQRAEYVLVLIRILEPEWHGRQLVFAGRFLQVLHRGLRVRVPQVLQLLDDFLGHVTGAAALGVGGLLDEPRQQRLVAVDERNPLAGVPVVFAQVGGVPGAT